MESLFSPGSASKYARERKSVEFAKKKGTVTPRLDEEEQALADQREARKLEKKAKRKVKPRKEEREAETEKKSKAVYGEKESSLNNSKSTSTSATKGSVGDSKIEDDVRSDKDDRTIFLGNVPITETEKSLIKFCSEFGDVESVRLRSLPVAGTAVDEAGNQDLVRRVCAIKKKFGTQKGSLNAYVVFKSKESVAKALGANNCVMGLSKSQKGGDGDKKQKGRHVRIDLMNPTLFDPATSVFVGGIPLYCDEEELREHFAEVLAGGQDDIRSVRIVRDPETLLGKGFAYVLLSDKDAVMQALTLHQKKYRKRWELRVTVCGKRTKRGTQATRGGTTAKSSGNDSDGHVNKKGKNKGKGESWMQGDSAPPAAGVDAELASAPASEAAGAKAGQKKRRWRDLAPEELEAKKARTTNLINAAAAAKRIAKGGSRMQKGNKNTRNAVLVGKGQKKKEKGRKGKRLGGNVKKAMKAAQAAKKD